MGEGWALVFFTLCLVALCRWVGQVAGYALSALTWLPARDWLRFLASAILRILPFAAPFGAVVAWLELTGGQVTADWAVTTIVLLGLLAVFGVSRGMRGALAAQGAQGAPGTKADRLARISGRVGAGAAVLFLLLGLVLGIRGA